MKPYGLVTALAATACLAACVGAGTEGTQSTGAAAPTGRVVNVYNWPDYIAPGLLEQFTTETGIKVNNSTFALRPQPAKAAPETASSDSNAPADLGLQLLCGSNRHLPDAGSPNQPPLEGQADRHERQAHRAAALRATPTGSA